MPDADEQPGADYHFGPVQAAAFAPGGTVSVGQLTVQQRGVVSPPPPLPSAEEIAAGQALLAALPTGDDAPIPAPATFRLAQRMPLTPNPLFVGRADELRQLAAMLKQDGAVAITTGIGGIGKPQPAVCPPRERRCVA
jgi:hypothetical protein